MARKFSKGSVGQKVEVTLDGLTFEGEISTVFKGDNWKLDDRGPSGRRKTAFGLIYIVAKVTKQRRRKKS